MREQFSAFQQLGASVAAVSFSPPASVARYLDQFPLPFPVLSDPERLAYAAFGLGKTTWRDIFRPAVVGRYLRLILGGWFPWKPARGDDLLQLGGDVVVTPERRVAYAHVSGEPTDRPPVATLLRAVRAAVEG